MIAVLAASLCLQLVAAVLALRHVRATSGAWGWALIALGLVLMSGRRAVTLAQLWSGEITGQPSTELIALAISILMLVGVVRIGSVLERLERAERLVRARERDVRGILDGTPDGILLARGGRWVYANPTATRLLSLEASGSSEPQAVIDALSAANASRLDRELLAPDAEAGTSLELELPGREPRVTVEFVTGPMIEFGGTPARLLALRDRSERKLLEEQFLQAQKLEALGRMAGGIAHDFNNLLAAITTSAELARRALPAEHDATEHLTHVAHAAERSAALTRQLLTFSSHGGKKSEPIELGRVVGSTRAILETLVGRSIRIVMACEPHLASVKADRSQLEQVLVNLVVNARDAMPDGGEISLRTREVKLDGKTAQPFVDAAAGTYVVLEVTDTGSGMTPEVQARAFDPFFTTKEPGKGSGLGLASCYAIARRLGGSIAVQSTLGRGSTFEFWLPATTEVARADTEPATSKQVVRAGAVVLVVEDERLLRSIAARILTRGGFVAIEAADAAAALDALSRRDDIAVLFTDIRMPGMSGLELTRRVRRDQPNIRVLLTTGDAHDLGDLAETPLLEKPYLPQTLLDRVGALLDVATDSARPV